MDDSAVMRLRGVSLTAALLIVSVLLPWQNLARAHVFVNRSEPRGGATLGAPPAQIRIWFDGPVESLFAAIRVESDDKRRVDKGNGRVNTSDNRLLEVTLPPLPRGRYRVFWSVIARDGHRREGNFSFLIK